MRKIASSSRSPLQTIKRFSSCSQTWPPESTRAVHSSGVRRGGRTAGCRSRRKPRWRSCTRVRCLRSSRTKRCKSTAAMDMSPIIRWNGCSGMRSSRRSARGRAKSSGSSSRVNYSVSPSPTLRCGWFVARGRRRGHRGCPTERTMCEAYRDRSSAMSTNPVRRAGRCESGHASPRSPGNREHAADDSEGDPHNAHAQPCGTDEDSRRAGDGQDEHDDAPDHVQLGPEVQERARDDHQGPEGDRHARERRDETRGMGPTEPVETSRYPRMAPTKTKRLPIRDRMNAPVGRCSKPFPNPPSTAAYLIPWSRRETDENLARQISLPRTFKARRPFGERNAGERIRGRAFPETGIHPPDVREVRESLLAPRPS